MKHKTIKVSNNPNLNNETCPFPLDVIPNYMGINLCSVERIDWTEQDDGQLVSINIVFLPEPAEAQQVSQ